MVFLLSSIGLLERPKLFKRSFHGGNGYWSGLPHSLWNVSPSSVPAAASVHAVNVLSPPDTIATSCSFKSRAPRRSNTLFWSFMLFSFHHFGSVERAQALQKEVFTEATTTRRRRTRS